MDTVSFQHDISPKQGAFTSSFIFKETKRTISIFRALDSVHRSLLGIQSMEDLDSCEMVSPSDCSDSSRSPSGCDNNQPDVLANVKPGFGEAFHCSSTSASSTSCSEESLGSKPKQTQSFTTFSKPITASGNKKQLVKVKEFESPIKQVPKFRTLSPRDVRAFINSNRSPTVVGKLVENMVMSRNNIKKINVQIKRCTMEDTKQPILVTKIPIKSEVVPELINEQKEKLVELTTRPDLKLNLKTSPSKVANKSNLKIESPESPIKGLPNYDIISPKPFSKQSSTVFVPHGKEKFTNDITAHDKENPFKFVNGNIKSSTSDLEDDSSDVEQHSRKIPLHTSPVRPDNAPVVTPLQDVINELEALLRSAPKNSECIFSDNNITSPLSPIAPVTNDFNLNNNNTIIKSGLLMGTKILMSASSDSLNSNHTNILKSKETRDNYIPSPIKSPLTLQDSPQRRTRTNTRKNEDAVDGPTSQRLTIQIEYQENSPSFNIKSEPLDSKCRNSTMRSPRASTSLKRRLKQKSQNSLNRTNSSIYSKASVRTSLQKSDSSGVYSEINNSRVEDEDKSHYEIVDSSFDPEKFCKNAGIDMSMSMLSTDTVGCMPHDSTLISGSVSSICLSTIEPPTTSALNVADSSVATIDASLLLSTSEGTNSPTKLGLFRALTNRLRESLRRKPRKESRTTAVAAHDIPEAQKTLLSEQTITGLMKKATYQQSVARQVSNAVLLCRAKPEFSDSVELVEAERQLLLATHREQSALNELSRIDYEQNRMETEGKGSIKISNITLATKYSSPERNFSEYYVAILAQGEKVFAAKTVRAENGFVSFKENFIFQKIHFNFIVKIEIYTMKMKRSLKIYSHESKYHLNKDTKKKITCPSPQKILSPPCSMRLGEAKKSLHFKQNKTTNGIETSRFTLLGSLELKVGDLSRFGPWKLDGAPLSSPLTGSIDLELSSSVTVVADAVGFLTVGAEAGGAVAWHRRWCCLDGPLLSYWNYPQEQSIKDPIGTIDMRNCVMAWVSVADRSICPRPRTLLIETARAPQSGDRNSIVIQCKPAYTITKHFLSADNTADLNNWKRQLNDVISTLRTWNAMNKNDFGELQVTEI